MCTFSDNYHNTFNNNNNYPLRQDNIFYLGFESFDSFFAHSHFNVFAKYTIKATLRDIFLPFG